MDKFKGKNVIVTGTSRGIGKSIANYFYDEGARVMAISRNESACMYDDRWISVCSSIDNTECILKAMNNAKFIPDILINNAGIICYENLIDITREQLERVFSTNVFDTFLLTQMIVKEMISHNVPGVIVNTLSFASFIPSAGSGVYAASKSALNSFTRTMAAEWAPYGIRVNGYSPGVVETEMTIPAIEKNRQKMINDIALHEIAEVQQMNEIVGFLASDASSYITGINLDASGGKFIVQNSGQVWKDAELKGH